MITNVWDACMTSETKIKVKLISYSSVFNVIVVFAMGLPSIESHLSCYAKSVKDLSFENFIQNSILAKSMRYITPL